MFENYDGLTTSIPSSFENTFTSRPMPVDNAMGITARLYGGNPMLMPRQPEPDFGMNDASDSQSQSRSPNPLLLPGGGAPLMSDPYSQSLMKRAMTNQLLQFNSQNGPQDEQAARRRAGLARLMGALAGPGATRLAESDAERELKVIDPGILAEQAKQRNGGLSTINDVVQANDPYSIKNQLAQQLADIRNQRAQTEAQRADDYSRSVDNQYNLGLGNLGVRQQQADNAHENMQHQWDNIQNLMDNRDAMTQLGRDRLNAQIDQFGKQLQMRGEAIRAQLAIAAQNGDLRSAQMLQQALMQNKAQQFDAVIAKNKADQEMTFRANEKNAQGDYKYPDLHDKYGEKSAAQPGINPLEGIAGMFGFGQPAKAEDAPKRKPTRDEVIDWMRRRQQAQQGE